MTKQVIAHQKFIRQTPQKLRLVADMIRPLSVEDSLVQLKMSSKRGAITMHKVLTQAKANAINAGLRTEALKIFSIEVGEGPTFKRWNPVSRGRAHPIMKRTCHIKITLEGADQIENKAKPKKVESVRGK